MNRASKVVYNKKSKYCKRYTLRLLLVKKMGNKLFALTGYEEILKTISKTYS